MGFNRTGMGYLKYIVYIYIHMGYGLYKNGGECVLSELPLLDRILCSKSIDPNFFAPK